jgi:RHS repeat-associated protein
LTDGSGAIASGARYNYDAYGVQLGTQSSTLNPSLTSLLYTGEQFDTGLQQYYLRARYYNQSNGRFNSLDSFKGSNFDPQSLHKYCYTHDDPTNGIDPSGLYPGGIVGVLATLCVAAIVFLLLYLWMKEAVRRKRPITAAGQITPKNVIRVDLFSDPADVDYPNYVTITNRVSNSLSAIGYTQADIGQFNQETMLYIFTKDSLFDKYPLLLANDATGLARWQLRQLSMTTEEYTSKKEVILPKSFLVNSTQYTSAQWGLILHMQREEVRDGDSLKAAYKKEIRYRSTNNPSPLPRPPAQPSAVLFGEEDYDNALLTERTRQQLYDSGPSIWSTW